VYVRHFPVDLVDLLRPFTISNRRQALRSVWSIQPSSRSIDIIVLVANFMLGPEESHDLQVVRTQSLQHFLGWNAFIVVSSRSWGRAISLMTRGCHNPDGIRTAASDAQSRAEAHYADQHAANIPDPLLKSEVLKDKQFRIDSVPPGTKAHSREQA
jgi:hypothetical protein